MVRVCRDAETWSSFPHPSEKKISNGTILIGNFTIFTELKLNRMLLKFTQTVMSHM